MDELQIVDITSPHSITALKKAHSDNRIIVPTLTINPEAECLPNSIEVSWIPPTKNIDRILSFKAFLSTTSGVVRECYSGKAMKHRAEGLRPHLEYVFCVKAEYEDGSFLWSEPRGFQTRA